jgi:hypothetical protein
MKGSIHLLHEVGRLQTEAQLARPDSESSDFCRLIQPKAIRLSGNVPIVTTLKGPGDARTAAASNAMPSFLSVVAKLVLTICIVFCEDGNSQSGGIVNGTKDPLQAEAQIR